MLKKAVQQGRKRVETGGGTRRTSWGRSPIQWILANGKTPPALPPSEYLNRYVEDFDKLRTKLAGFFSILPAGSAPGAKAAAYKRLAQSRGGRKVERSSRDRRDQSSGKTRLILRWWCSRRSRGRRGFSL